MGFKTYIKLALPIAIQHVTVFGTTETAVWEELLTIWKTLSELDTKAFILAWHPRVEHTVRPIQNVDLSKQLSKKVVNDKYKKPLKMG